MTHIPKAEFFRKPLIGEIRGLRPHQDARAPSRVPRGIARIIENLAHDEHYLIEAPIITAEKQGTDRDPRTFIRHGRYLTLRRQQRPGHRDIFRATPHLLLAELFPLDWAPWEAPPLGYAWHVPGSRAHSYIIKPLLEEVEGALLFWHDLHRKPGETPATLEERLRAEVHLLTGSVREGPPVENGVHLRVKVQSRTPKRVSYDGALYQVPVVADPHHVGRNWRSAGSTSRSVYSHILNASMPSRCEEPPVGKRQLVTAEENAQFHKAGEYFAVIEGNPVPRVYLPVLRFSRAFLDYHSKLVFNTFICDPIETHLRHGKRRTRLLNDAEKNIAGVQPKANMGAYVLGPQGRAV